MFALDAYLARIGNPSIDRADLPTLTRLHRAHIEAIPFENLDIQMGLRINLDADALQSALVHRQRGGYCFQHNTLFRLALQAMGFTPRTLEARVRFDNGGVLSPRTHMVLAVPVDGVEYLTDVGFGGIGIIAPIPMDADGVLQDGWTYRITREGHLRVLQRARSDGWDDLYVFGDEAAAPIDYIVGNWYTSTHPDSRFVRTLTAQRMIGSTRHVLRNLTYGIAREGGAWQTRQLTRAELVPLLREVFGLDVPADARFRAIDDISPSASPAG